MQILRILALRASACKLEDSVHCATLREEFPIHVVMYSHHTLFLYKCLQVCEKLFVKPESRTNISKVRDQVRYQVCGKVRYQKKKFVHLVSAKLGLRILVTY